MSTFSMKLALLAKGILYLTLNQIISFKSFLYSSMSRVFLNQFTSCLINYFDMTGLMEMMIGGLRILSFLEPQ